MSEDAKYIMEKLHELHRMLCEKEIKAMAAGIRAQTVISASVFGYFISKLEEHFENR